MLKLLPVEITCLERKSPVWWGLTRAGGLQELIKTREMANTDVHSLHYIFFKALQWNMPPLAALHFYKPLQLKDMSQSARLT